MKKNFDLFLCGMQAYSSLLVLNVMTSASLYQKGYLIHFKLLIEFYSWMWEGSLSISFVDCNHYPNPFTFIFFVIQNKFWPPPPIQYTDSKENNITIMYVPFRLNKCHILSLPCFIFKTGVLFFLLRWYF